MLIIHPDFGRRIDLPGAGPCPRPVDIDRSHTGFSHLVSLRVYSFAEGVAIDGEAEADEVFIVLMRGAAAITIERDALPASAFALRREGGQRVVYMPPRASYRLVAANDCDIAYARAEPSGTDLPEVRGFASAGDRLDIVGHATGMDLSIATVRSGRKLALADHGASPERFMHLRSNDVTTAVMIGQRLDDWDSVALDDGDDATVEIETGAADILTISATGARTG